jgi:hypothetical protein
MLVTALLALCLAGAAPAAQPIDMSAFPFFPSLINSVSGRPVASTEFEDPTICQGCHAEIYKQWQGSMHSNAMKDPVFLALWKIGIKKTDGAVERLCAGCHTGIGTLAGEVKVAEDGTVTMSDIAWKGVQCDLCHTVTGSTMLKSPTFEPQNASILLDPGSNKRGPYKDSESPYHNTVYSELHTKAEFCANCHHVYHPETHFPVERTYDEWKYSLYARNGIVCQDCHMMPVEKAIETAKTMKKATNPGRAAMGAPLRDTVRTHEFVGANAVVTSLLGAKRQSEIAVKRLQGAASLDLSLPNNAAPGELVRFKVKVTNETAGHNLPTSLTELRQVWVDVRVADATDTVIYRSGALDDAGTLDPEAKMFRSVAVDKDGHHTIFPWEIARFDSVTTIPPKGSATLDYAFLMPATARGPVKVDVTLRYRSFPQEVANLLLGKDAPTIPVIDMVSAAGAMVVRK